MTSTSSRKCFATDLLVVLASEPLAVAVEIEEVGLEGLQVPLQLLQQSLTCEARGNVRLGNGRLHERLYRARARHLQVELLDLSFWCLITRHRANGTRHGHW